MVRDTPLTRFPWELDPRIELRLKLECLQETNSFKARGAWNQVAQLSEGERAAGVVTASSGNHGRALAWAARRAGIRATICMPRDAYPSKIEACRELGAEVLLGETRDAAEALCRERAAAGQVVIPPYDAARTLEGAGTVGLEIAQQWPEVEVVLVCVGGGGLLAGTSLALRRALGEQVTIYGVEPEGAPAMQRSLAAGAPVRLERIETAVQGLCPPTAGALPVAICLQTVDRVFTLPDAAIFAAQKALVGAGWTVEPAGGAATALVLSGSLPPELLEGRSAQNPLRVAATVSGGNPDPAQLAALRAELGQ
ncbi:MAG: pyridoxal-phosphate dependent enzyme [Planctomycetes bacterium]|nr:pyridoxal-phosphate dependent enzyme [Planctomycetota bacterium]